MSNLQLISVLDIFMKVTLVAAILFFVLAVLFFFLFKIPQIYMIKTGKAQRKTIEQMRAINAETGRLSNAGTGMTGIFGSSSDLVSDNHQQTTENQGASETSVLMPETSVLSENSATANAEQGMTNMLNNGADESKGKFVIVKKIMEIHTQEVIS
ncbi:hypothetical protein [Ruminococcus sp.]